MCLAVPGRIVAIEGHDHTPMATVDFDGIRKEVCLAFLPEAELHDYVLVHVGFAITAVDQDAAEETLALLRASGRLEAEIGGPQDWSEDP